MLIYIQYVCYILLQDVEIKPAFLSSIGNFIKSCALQDHILEERKGGFKVFTQQDLLSLSWPKDEL